MDDTQPKNTNPADDTTNEEVIEEESPTEETTETIDPVTGEVEESVDESTMTPEDTKAVGFIQLENIINGYLGDLERLQRDMKEQSQMFRDTLENDADYAACMNRARDISKEKKTIQDKLIQDPSLALVESKIRDLKSEVKETQQALSDYLQQFYEQSGLRQITGVDGEIRDIVTFVKLVKKRD
ncbi:hypothetical protein BH09PAT2_BH09PAT2_09330 [soil metagenome]